MSEKIEYVKMCWLKKYKKLDRNEKKEFILNICMYI